MQALKTNFFRLIIAIVLLLPMGAAAQTLASSVNTYSPYSMYGMGELSTPGNAIQRSMGGVGVAMFSTNMTNIMNPAAYGFTPRQSFLFNFGIEGGHYRNKQTKYGATNNEVETAYNSINIHDVAFQMPLAKGLGLGFSLSPYSNVGYSMYNDDLTPGIAGNVGRVRYQYYGDGDVTDVKLGVGWSPFSRFSIGAALVYYWGNISRSYNAMVSNVITGSGEFSSTVGTDTYDVSKIKAQFGIMFNPILSAERVLTLAATYDLGGAIEPDMKKYVYVDNLLTSVVREQNEKSLPLRLPHQVAAGFFYQDSKVRFGVDYVYQNWGSQNTDYMESGGKGVHVAYTDTHTIKAGFEIIPRFTDVGNYLNRMSYRVGARYGDYYQTFGGSKVKQYAITAGIGLPVQLFGRSSVDIGFEYGHRDPANDTIMINDVKVGMVKQNYFKMSIGLTLFNDRWFYRYKYE